MTLLKPLASEDKLRFISAIILLGFVGAMLFHTIIASFNPFHPLSSFLFTQSDRFNDFFNPLPIHLNPYLRDPPGVYFPFSYLIIDLFNVIPNSRIALILYEEICCLSLFWFLSYFLQTIATQLKLGEYFQYRLILIFLSYPVLFCLDRGNFEFLIFLSTAFFLICFLEKKYFMSLFFLAFSIAMKLFTILFLFFLIQKKRYWEALTCLVLVSILTLGAFFLFQGNFLPNFKAFLLSLQEYNLKYCIGDVGFEYSSSIFSLIKFLIKSYGMSPAHYAHCIEKIYPCYFLAVMLMSGGIFWCLLRLSLVFWQQAMLITGMILLFPSVSPEYRLLYLFIPLVLFLTTDHTAKTDKFYALLFGLLFIPKTYYVFKYAGGFNSTSLLNIWILILFMSCILVQGLKTKVFTKNLKDLNYSQPGKFFIKP